MDNNVICQIVLETFPQTLSLQHKHTKPWRKHNGMRAAMSGDDVLISNEFKCQTSASTSRLSCLDESAAGSGA